MTTIKNNTVKNNYMQAIVTKYLGATNTKGSRIKATASAGSVTVGYDHALNSSENHDAACKALADKMEWSGVWVGGGTETGYVYVNTK